MCVCACAQVAGVEDAEGSDFFGAFARSARAAAGKSPLPDP